MPTSTMKQFIILFLIVVVSASSVLSLDLGFDVKIRDGLTKLTFESIPLSVSKAKAAEWLLTPRPDGPKEYQSLILYCEPSERIICALYNRNAIAGIQVSIPIDKIIEAQFDVLTQGFVKWDVQSEAGTRSYWANTQYFLSPESANNSDISSEDSEPVNDSEHILRQGSVWVTGFNGKLFNISTQTSVIQNSPFMKQGCQPGKGVHHLYNITKTSPEPCRADNILPWFALVYEDEMVGTGFFFLGKVKLTEKLWFERPPGLFLRLLVPNAPDCLYNLSDHGVVSTHIYYVKKPNLIPCPLIPTL